MEAFENKVFYYAIACTVGSLIILTLIQTNKGYLTRLGLSVKFIQDARRYTFVRNLVLLLYFTGLIIASGVFVSLFELHSSAYLKLAIQVIFVFLLTIPAAFLDNLIWSRILKRRMDAEKPEITFDFAHKALRLIFNPVVGFLITGCVLLYTIVIIRPFFLIYIHLAIPWLFYASLKNRKFFSTVHLRKNYFWSFVGITVNYVFVLYYVIYGAFFNGESMDVLKGVSGLIVSLLLISCILYNFLSFKDFNRLTDAL